MNRAIFTGRLTKDPELRYTNDGRAVCTINIAVDDGWGEKKQTYFPAIVLWRHNAEYIGKFAHKGGPDRDHFPVHRAQVGGPGGPQAHQRGVCGRRGAHPVRPERGKTAKAGPRRPQARPVPRGQGIRNPADTEAKRAKFGPPPQNENGGEYEELDSSDGDLPF